MQSTSANWSAIASLSAPPCSPRLIEGAHPLRTAADLRHHVLIHDNVTYDDGRQLWDAWFEAAGMPEADTSHGLRFSHAMLALEAAADGMGVALGIPVLAQSDRGDVVAFHNWLLAEAARDPKKKN